jgi:ABC-type transport system involved in multi-copper enzyme maturation permease subunit
MKSRVIYNTFFLGLGLLLVSYIATEFTYGVPQKVAIDFGLGALSLSATGIAIFLGGNLIHKEIENRTIQMILSRPVKRHVFIIGRALGMCCLLIINVLILGILTTLMYFFLGGELQALILWTIFFCLLESIIMLNVVILFSMLTTTTLSIILSLIVLVLGHNINNSLELTGVKANPLLEYVIKVYAFFFPDLSKLNIKEFVLYENNLDLLYLSQISAYGIVYPLILLFISSFLFSNKDLE